MSKTLEDPFIIIDGSSYLYRAYNVFPFLTNRFGEQTGAIYGVINMLRSLFLKYQPTHAVIVFDNTIKTFRHRLFKKYKSHRVPMPDNLRKQIKPLYSIIKMMGIPLLLASDVEADDVIGTLAYKIEKIKKPVLISTNDKDMLQLVTDRISIINNINSEVLDLKGVINKYGLIPKLIIDLIALMGDQSDNIPGVPGIGKKIALALIQKLGGLDIIYAKSEKIASLDLRGAKKIAIKLKQNKEVAYLSYQLASIKKDVKLNLTYQQLKIQKPLNKELIKVFKKYEFKKWITDIEVRS